MNDYEIEQVIPQRAPVKMVDCLLDIHEDTTITTLTIRRDNFFLETDGNLTEAGIIEHLAQSASALAGCLARRQGTGKVPVGYIGEIRDFHCQRFPHIGETMTTVITRNEVFGDFTCLSGETRTADGPTADIQLKIYIDPNY